MCKIGKTIRQETKLGNYRPRLSLVFTPSFSRHAARSAVFPAAGLTKLRGWDYEHNYISGGPSASCRERATWTVLASSTQLSLSTLSSSLQNTRYVTSSHCLRPRNAFAKNRRERAPRVLIVSDASLFFTLGCQPKLVPRINFELFRERTSLFFKNRSTLSTQSVENERVEFILIRGLICTLLSVCNYFTGKNISKTILQYHWHRLSYGYIANKFL